MIQTNVTVVAIDCVAHNLTRLALTATLDQLPANSAVVYTDFVGIFMGTPQPILPVRTVNFKTIEAVDEFLWYEVCCGIRSSHILNIQYDGYVLDGTRWDDAWLQYDYIGAPWPWHKTHPVGNGGFSLRSTRLMRFLAANQARFPRQFPEDETLCRKYRAALEAEGFKWAPLEVAQIFAFEREEPHPTFGFHGIFNMPHILDKFQFAKWKALAPDYVRLKPEWKELP